MTDLPQFLAAGVNRCNRIGAAVEETAQAGRQSAGAGSRADRLAGARDSDRATGPGMDAGHSGAAGAGGCDGSGTGSELRVAAVSSTNGPDAAARCR